MNYSCRLTALLRLTKQYKPTEMSQPHGQTCSPPHVYSFFTLHNSSGNARCKISSGVHPSGSKATMSHSASHCHKLKRHHTTYNMTQQTLTWCCALKLLMFRLCHEQRREYLAHLWPSALVTPTVTSPSCSSCTVALKSLCLASSCRNRTSFFQNFEVPRCKPQHAEHGVMAAL